MLHCRKRFAQGKTVAGSRDHHCFTPTEHAEEKTLVVKDGPGNGPAFVFIVCTNNQPPVEMQPVTESHLQPEKCLESLCRV